MNTIPNEPPTTDEVLARSAEFFQRKAAKEAIGREIARMVELDDATLAARVRIDEAQAAYRLAVREAARKAIERY